MKNAGVESYHEKEEDDIVGREGGRKSRVVMFPKNDITTALAARKMLQMLQSTGNSLSYNITCLYIYIYLYILPKYFVEYIELKERFFLYPGRTPRVGKSKIN